jgi:hypothetical protein
MFLMCVLCILYNFIAYVQQNEQYILKMSVFLKHSYMFRCSYIILGRSLIMYTKVVTLVYIMRFPEDDVLTSKLHNEFPYSLFTT